MKKSLVAASFLAIATCTLAAPRWEQVAGYMLKSGAYAKVYVDTESVTRVGSNRRVWAVTDYSEAQTGTWAASAGESTAYLSAVNMWLVDCATNDMALVMTMANDGAMGSGSILRTEQFDQSKARFNPSPPESVSESVAKKACALKPRN